MTDIAEQCARIAEEWIIPDERLERTYGERNAAGRAQSYTAREIAAAIRERMASQRDSG